MSLKGCIGLLKFLDHPTEKPPAALLEARHLEHLQQSGEGDWRRNLNYE